MDYDEFIADWGKELIYEVTGASNKLFGKSVRGQAGNPMGYVIVSCIVPP